MVESLKLKRSEEGKLRIFGNLGVRCRTQVADMKSQLALCVYIQIRKVHENSGCVFHRHVARFAHSIISSERLTPAIFCVGVRSGT